APATTSVNFLTAHDGFTLTDVVSYNDRHNEANGEHGNDGHGENFSDNLGAEGPTDDPGVVEARARRVRGMLATLLLSQGTPMLLAGDELGNGQGGNNNAYVQDNPTGWVDWSGVHGDLLAFTRELIALRRRLPVLRQSAYRHGRLRADGHRDVEWFRVDGTPMTDTDWHATDGRPVGVILRGTAGHGGGHRRRGELRCRGSGGEHRLWCRGVPALRWKWRRGRQC
ncbi:MAG: glycogen debranching protein GlgX, partial [Corynebacterium variabile]